MEHPWPIEDQRRSPLMRARTVAGMYRTALGLVNPVRMAELDNLILQYGERWVSDRVFLYEDGDHLTAYQAAEMLGVSIESVRKYRERGRLTGIETVDGWRYRAEDVRSFRTKPAGRPTKV